MSKSRFYNIEIDIHDYDSALRECKGFYDADTCKTLYYINAHCFNIAQKNDRYFKALNQADLLLNDGIGVSIAAWLAKVCLLKNMNGSDFTPALLDQAAQMGKRVYLLGSKPGVTDKTVEVLEKRYPNLMIVGHHHGFFDEDVSKEIVREINSKKVDLLVVGMGVPIQELWIEAHKHEFETVKIATAAGAVMDFISGTIKRAPMWIRDIEMEWIHRLIKEPRRMFKRYGLGSFQYFFYIFSFLIQGKHKGKS